MFKRIGNLFKGFIGLFVSGLETRNPEALLEVEKENLRTQIAQYNQGLALHAGLCEKLMSQVRKLEGEEKELRARTSANLRVGNKDAAKQYALRLSTVSRELEENRSQAGQAEKTYNELIRARDVSIKAAQAKIQALSSGLNDLKIQKATAALTEMASGMIAKIGGSGDTLDRLQTMVEEERTKAAGKARVARDSMSTHDIALKESEQNALADQALADFAAKEGIVLEPEPTSAPVSGDGTSSSSTTVGGRTMGPQTN
jgi:phage shock protein A